MLHGKPTSRSMRFERRVWVMEVWLMLDDYRLRADSYREIARQLRGTAFNRVPFDLCRKEQLLALARITR
jgi:hypothetical protein